MKNLEKPMHPCVKCGKDASQITRKSKFYIHSFVDSGVDGMLCVACGGKDYNKEKLETEKRMEKMRKKLGLSGNAINRIVIPYMG